MRCGQQKTLPPKRRSKATTDAHGRTRMAVEQEESRKCIGWCPVNSTLSVYWLRIGFSGLGTAHSLFVLVSSSSAKTAARHVRHKKLMANMADLARGHKHTRIETRRTWQDQDSDWQSNAQHADADLSAPRSITVAGRGALALKQFQPAAFTLAWRPPSPLIARHWG
jgi:hypothetical protein